MTTAQQVSDAECARVFAALATQWGEGRARELVRLWRDDPRADVAWGAVADWLDRQQ